jgi:hypothetical protein
MGNVREPHFTGEDDRMVKRGDLHPQYVTDKNGEKTSVILPMSEFEN